MALVVSYTLHRAGRKVSIREETGGRVSGNGRSWLRINARCRGCLAKLSVNEPVISGTLKVAILPHKKEALGAYETG